MRKLFHVMAWGARPLLSPLMLLSHLSITQVVALTVLVSGWAWYEYGALPFGGGGGGGSKIQAPAALKQAIADAVKELPSQLPPPRRSPQPTLVLPLEDDRISEGGLLVTGAICEALKAQGAYAPVDQSKLDQALNKFAETAGLPTEPVTDRKTAARLAKAATPPAEVAIFGKVDRLEPLDDQHYAVAFNVEAFNVDDDKTLLKRDFPLTAKERPSRIWQWWPLLAVAAFALLWPPIASPIMMRILKMENNFANAMALLILTAVPAAIAFPVVFGTSTGAWRMVAYVVGILLGGLWCTAVMSWVAERQSA